MMAKTFFLSGPPGMVVPPGPTSADFSLKVRKLHCHLISQDYNMIQHAR